MASIPLSSLSFPPSLFCPPPQASAGNPPSFPTSSLPRIPLKSPFWLLYKSPQAAVRAKRLPGIEAQAFKRSDGRRKGKTTNKPETKKKQNIWADEPSIRTTPTKVRRRSPGRDGQRVSSSRPSEERTSKDNRDQPSDLPKTFPKAGNISGSTEMVEESDDLHASFPTRILVSAAMPVETESVLQTKLPVTIPSWSAFTSSLVGVWRGIGAAFSPVTAEMEPIALGDNQEYLYDCRVISTVEELQGKNGSSIRRRILWVVGNPRGEQGQIDVKVQNECVEREIEEDDEMQEAPTEKNAWKEARKNKPNADILLEKDKEELVPLLQSSYDDLTTTDQTIQLPGYSKGRHARESSADLDTVDISYKDVMEEDIIELEPGLVFFEDGSYSRGPLELLAGDSNSGYFSSPTYRIEQCLVIGHTRLRLVHTIAVEDGGEEIQLLRVAVYEEEWMEPCQLESLSGTGEGRLKLFSQRRRLLPHELAGSWKVYEISATAVLPEKPSPKPTQERPSFVYLSLETLKRRLSPEIPVHFVDEDILDMQNVTILWLPGGITAYVDIKEDGVLTIGTGCYNIDGINHVMERDYSADGKLFEVRSKFEVRGG